MYTGELNGMTLTLPDEDYEILKKRLMVNKAVRGDERYVISAPCICAQYEYNCNRCSLGGEGRDCSRYVSLFDGESVEFGQTRMWWQIEDDKPARAVIKSMRKALLGMKHEEV